MDISQIAILVCGSASVYLVARTDHMKRWGYLFGLCAQPFWFWTTYHNQQWGIFIVSFWYTFSWAMGVYNYWIRGKHEHP